MARAAFNVAVYPYRQMANGTFEYALLQRSDAGFWQGVSGGGEDEETPLAAAQRETFEETGIPADSVFLPLDTVEPIRVTVFGNSHLWGEDVYVVPQYCFGVQADGRTIVLSHEHADFRWLPYAEADELLRYDGNKTALWELNQRLRGKGPRG